MNVNFLNEAAWHTLHAIPKLGFFLGGGGGGGGGGGEASFMTDIMGLFFY